MEFSDVVLEQCGQEGSDKHMNLKILWRLLRLMKAGFIRYLSAILILSVSLSAFETITALLLKNIITRAGRYGQGDIFEGLWSEVIICVLLGLIILVIAAVAFYVYFLEAKKGGANLQKLLYSKCMRLPYSYYENTHSGELFKKERRKINLMSGCLDGLNQTFELLGALVFIVLGIFFVSTGITTVGSLAAIYVLYGTMSWNLLQVGLYIPSMASYLANAKRVFEFLDSEEEPTAYRIEYAEQNNSEKNKNRLEQNKAVQMQNVTFSYDGRQDVLHDFNLCIEKGKCVAIKGESGKGKTTIAKLLQGFYPIKSGNIIVNGRDFSMYKLSEIRGMIGFVPQEPYLYDVSIEENIRYGRPDADKEDIIKAAEMANAHEFIMQLENGYETRAGERGNRLSGGQRQRIAIARAILKDSPILILDEATSALDNKSELLVNEALERLMYNRTTIVIAHRQSTLERADEVIEI